VRNKCLQFMSLPMLLAVGILCSGSVVAQKPVKPPVAPKKVVTLPGNPAARQMASALCIDAKAFVANQAGSGAPSGQPQRTATSATAPKKLTAIIQLASNCSKPPVTLSFECKAGTTTLNGQCDEPGKSYCTDLKGMCENLGGKWTIL